MARRRESISASEARRLALAAQGFSGPREAGRAPGWGIRRVLAAAGMLQIDSVNVLCRAHYLPIFSRLGPYPMSALDDAANRAPRRLFEYLGHEASLLPVSLQPMLRWRMERPAEDAWGSVRRVQEQRPDLVAAILEQVAERGPVAVADLASEEPEGETGPWWDWSQTKWAVVWLFWSGQITSARRRNFQRLYDLPERVLPAEVMATPTPPVADAQRELVRMAARALGIAAERDLRDYFRMPLADARARIGELVQEGELQPVSVEGWGRTAGYLTTGARIPRRVDARCLVGPFDSLIWERSRVERVFGFSYKLEVYVPRAKRVHGYYVLPFMLGDRLVARVDLKADRARGDLLARRVHLEPDAPAGTLAEVGDELALMAGWLGLERVKLPRAG
jgi:uncharacterized protein YcaQ